MKHFIRLLISVVVPALIVSCNNERKSQDYQLTESEKRICDTLKIDASVIQSIRVYNSNKIEPFHYSLSKMYNDGQETEIDPVYRQGLVFKEQNSKSYDLIFNLKDDFKKKGYSIFL